MDDSPNDDALETTSLDAVHEQLVQAGRPELGSALDGLRARMLATAGGLTPRTIGRYRLGRVLGSGSFGTVHEAEDPELDRRVAVKLLRVRSEKEAARVVREAQLLATLSHPNVVQVFEVGTTEDGRSPYVVMELIEGPTLRKWMSDGSHAWREVVEVVLRAAQGLWAAHQAGIIHRDLKPENVLMGRDGRPRVIDFGLARAMGGASEEPSEEATLRSGAHAPSVHAGSGGGSPQLTATGQVMGTPAYMAPEVFAGEHTPLSDQYALCVTLYEALFGRRPFAAESPQELIEKLLSQQAELPADRRGVPRHVGAIVLRGLRRAPRERFGDLGRFVEALERSLRPRRWALAIAGVAVLGAGGVLLASTQPASEPPPPEVCAVGDAAWARLREQATIPAALEAPLASYQRAWQQTEQALCTEGEGIIDWERRRCLDRGLRDASALVSVLGKADAATVDPAKAMQSLAPPTDCAKPEGDGVMPPPAGVDLAPLEQRLSHLRALETTAQLVAGLALSGPLLDDVRKAGYAPLLAEATYLRARMLLLGSDYEGARAMFEEAFFLAQETGPRWLAAHSAQSLVRLSVSDLGDLAAARRWVGHAEIAMERAGLDPRSQGMFLEGLASLAEREGNLVEATKILREAIVVDEAKGARSTMIGGLYNRLGVVLYSRGEYHEAIAALRKAESIYARDHGPDTPSRAVALDAIGVCLVQLGHYRAAYEHHLAALRIREASLAGDHVELGMSYGNLGQVLRELGRHDEALEYLERSRVLFIERLGDEHPHVAMAYWMLGQTREQTGPAGRELAARDYERAIRLFEAAGPPYAGKLAEVRAKLAALSTPTSTPASTEPAG